jgi:hypothetical protein
MKKAGRCEKGKNDVNKKICMKREPIGYLE